VIGQPDKIRAEWANRLRGAAERVLAATPLVAPDASDVRKRAFIDAFSDESGHRRHVDRPLLAWLLGLGGVEPRTGRVLSEDEQVWWLLASGSRWSEPAWLRKSGALTSEGIRAPIEAWTQTELATLAGLWEIARRDDDEPLRRRCMDAAAWFIAEVQPDNATGHPWGIAVFVERWIREGDIDARMYAEVLLHNCMVTRGVPDRFSACVLWAGMRALSAR
jgi:hypothetical protein